MEPTPIHASPMISPEEGLLDPGEVVPPRKNRRLRNRVACEGLSCTLGRVMGLSSTGMRISARGWCRIRQEDRVSLTLRDSENQLKLTARIAWVRRTGLLQYDAGMQFVDMSFDQKRDLAMMAQMAMPKLIMRKGTLADLPTE